MIHCVLHLMVSLISGLHSAINNKSVGNSGGILVLFQVDQEVNLEPLENYAFSHLSHIYLCKYHYRPVLSPN